MNFFRMVEFRINSKLTFFEWSNFELFEFECLFEFFIRIRYSVQSIVVISQFDWSAEFDEMGGVEKGRIAQFTAKISMQ